MRFIHSKKTDESKSYCLTNNFLKIDKFRKIVNQFHKLYCYNYPTTTENTFWMGIQALKCPLDLWIYQEILSETKPDLIIETGTHKGGSSLFLASICDILDKGKVISIDISSNEKLPIHKRIRYVTGNSVSMDIFDQVNNLISEYSASSNPSIMCILDSDHTKTHVLNEMKLYGELVSMNNYLIVEDTNINGNPIHPKWGSGPMEAVDEFLTSNKNFVIDKKREKYFMTFNPNGYLKKIR